jgi:hypothetical protein
MEIGNLAGGVFLGQALRAVAMTETEIAGAVNGGDQVALETEIVQGFHAKEPLVELAQQLSESRAADMADKVVEGLGVPLHDNLGEDDRDNPGEAIRGFRDKPGTG